MSKKLSILVLQTASFYSCVAIAEITEQAPVWIPEHFPEMIAIKAGSFTMGCVKSRDEVERGCNSDEKPAHIILLNAYEVSKTEITIGKFREFIQQTGYKTSAEKGNGCFSYKDGAWSKRNASNWENPGFIQTDQHPVVCVSWDDTQAYIKWLNSQINIQTLGKYRLLTEAEWEYAARGREDKQAYPWGNIASHDQANYSGKKGKDKWDRTAPVTSFPSNGFDLYDMHGNVWEWVQDKYQNSYKNAPKDGSAQESKGARRVFRGGSWSGSPGFLRSAYRNGFAPDDRNHNLGFRLARSKVK